MSYIGQTLPADTFQGFTTDSFTGDGSATTFTLSKTPFSEDTLIVVINNVIQKPTTNFTVSGTTLTIVGTAVASGDVIYATHLSGVIPSTLASKVDVNGVSDAIILDADADTTISADTDDQIDFKVAGTDLVEFNATGVIIRDGTTITTADNTDTLTLKSTDADASSGPNLRFYRNSSSPADNDVIVQVDFEGRNDNSQDVIYGQFLMSAQDVSDGTEDSVVTFGTMKAGSLTEQIGFNASEAVFNNTSADIDFRVESNDNTHMIFVNAANNEVGIGESSPSKTLQVQSETNHSNYVVGVEASSSSAPYGIGIDYPNSSPDNNDYWFMNAADATTSRFRITSQGDVLNHDNSYGSISDERIKQDIVDSSSQWDDIKALKIRNYKKKDDVRQHADKAPLEIGVIAQELETAGMSGLVSENPPTPADVASDSAFGTLYEDGDDIPRQYKVGDVKEAKTTVKSVKYSVLYMKAIKALQEAMTKIETLETKVKALEDA